MSASPDNRRRARWWALAASGACIPAMIMGYGPPEPVNPTAAGEFDPSRAMSMLQEFVGDGTPRAVGTPGHDAALDRLQATLAKLNCEVSTQKFAARGWDHKAAAMTNVLARVPGTSQGDEAPLVMLSAHYDGVPWGPGAGDNAAGVACALEVIAALGESPPPNDVLVLFTDGEETGLNGARAFVTQAKEWPQVGAVVNLDARGSSGPVHIFEVGADQPRHAQLLASLDLPAHSSSLAAEAYQRMPNGTDFTIYQRSHRAGFNLAFIGSPRNYHRPSDTIANLDPDTVSAMGSSALALVRALSGGASPMPTATELTRLTSLDPVMLGSDLPVTRFNWFDSVGLGVIAWPSAINLPLIGLSIAVMAWTVRCRRRLGIASLIGSALACAEALVGLVAAVLAGWLASQALRWSGLVDFPFPAAGIMWGDLGLLALGALLSTVCSRWLYRRRARRRTIECASWDSWFGGWLLVGSLAVLVAVAAPGAAHPLGIPLLVAALASLIALLGKFRTPDACAVATVTAFLLVWVPLEPSLADAFGLSLGGFTALRGALLALASRPLLLS